MVIAMDVDAKTINLVADCWVKLRKVESLKELDDDCKKVLCAIILKIAENDPSAEDDKEIREDLEACRALR